jgi:hypothetical protein
MKQTILVLCMCITLSLMAVPRMVVGEIFSSPGC